MATNTLSKVVTERVRLSYVHLFEPWALKPEDDKKYTATLLIPKSDKVTMNRLRGAEEAGRKAGTEKYGASWGRKGIKSVIHDGDEEADLEVNPEYAGHFYLSVSASTAYPPRVVDRQLQPILDATEVYSGCYARVSLRPYPYSFNGNHGVGFGLQNVQKLDDGESLGGGSSNVEDDFSAVEDGLI